MLFLIAVYGKPSFWDMYFPALTLGRLCTQSLTLVGCSEALLSAKVDRVEDEPSEYGISTAR